MVQSSSMVFKFKGFYDNGSSHTPIKILKPRLQSSKNLILAKLRGIMNDFLNLPDKWIWTSDPGSLVGVEFLIWSSARFGRSIRAKPSTLMISMIPKALTTATFSGGKASSDAATASSVWILAPPPTACGLLFSLGVKSLVFILLVWLLVVASAIVVVVVVDKKPGRNHAMLRCRIASCRGHLMYLFLNFVWSRKQKNARRRSRKLIGFCGPKCLEIGKPTASECSLRGLLLHPDSRSKSIHIKFGTISKQSSPIIPLVTGTDVDDVYAFTRLTALLAIEIVNLAPI